MMNVFQREREELEELRKHEKRINDFRQGMMDDMYRMQLRKEQKMSSFKIKSPRAKSKIILFI